jgi:hypothetical protein
MSRTEFLDAVVVVVVVVVRKQYAEVNISA